MIYDKNKHKLVDNSKARVFKTGYTRTNKQGVKFEIIGKIKTEQGKKAKYLIKFESSDDALMVVAGRTINLGDIQDLNTKTLFNVGYLGYGKHRSCKDGVPTREYSLWNRVLNRCYSEVRKETSPTYRDVIVDERWHNFQNFCEDLPLLYGYSDWINDNSEGRCRIEFDKDILCERLNINPKIYSKNTCMFVTQAENLEQSSKTGLTYKAIRLSDNYEEIFYNQRKFSRKFGLEHTCVADCCRVDKKVNTHKGWKFFIINNELEEVDVC